MQPKQNGKELWSKEQPLLDVALFGLKRQPCAMTLRRRLSMEHHQRDRSEAEHVSGLGTNKQVLLRIAGHESPMAF